MFDSDFVKQLQSGNKNSFKQLVDQHRDKVVRTALALVHNQQDAEDVAQDVFVKIYQTISTFKGESSLSTWIYRITVNTTLNFIRNNQKNKFLMRLESLLNPSKTENSSLKIKDNKTPEQDLINQQNAEYLHRAVDSLPEKQRIAFILSKYDDLSYQEICKVMDLSLSSVESLIHRAKENLQKKLFDFYKK